MDNNKTKVGNSSSTMNFDNLFGHRDSSSTGIFGSIFTPQSVGGRESRMEDVGSKSYGAPGAYNNKGASSNYRIHNKNTNTNNQNETVEPGTYFSSSIYYGGQENYFPRSRTTEPHHVFKKGEDKDEDGGDQKGNESNNAARGNWWQGSLYY